MRCLLLGARGFLGRHVRDALATDPRCTLITASRQDDDTDLRLDLAKVGPAEIESALRAAAVDVVINCAGTTSGTAQELVAGNVVTVANLTAAVDRLDPDGFGRTIRIVHLGSAAEYGPVPAGVPVLESIPANPTSPYGISKLAGSALLLAAARQAVVLRVFNPIGPGTPERLLPGRLVAQLRRAIETGEPARVGSLDAYRDLIDARDVAAAVVAAATAPGPLPPVLNVASGRATPLRELAALLAANAGTAPPEESTAGSDRSAGVSWQQADLTAITTALDWRPRIPLVDSLRDMWLASTGSDRIAVP